MAAGKRENSAQIILFTASGLVMVTIVSPSMSVPEEKPAIPRRRATRAPEMALPNFWAIVPEEKIRPVE